MIKEIKTKLNRINIILIIVICFLLSVYIPEISAAPRLKAGAAKVNITDTAGRLVNDTLYVKALVLDNTLTKAVIITIDAVAIGEIGHVRNNYLSNIRLALEKEFKIRPENVIINASHCHGKVCSDLEEKTLEAVRIASAKMFNVKTGSGRGFENRISENRRFKLANGREIDSRRAYSLPPDKQIAEVGPIDPEIGILRIDKMNGEPLAILYNFACHPIQGVPSEGNTADITGFASKTIENCFNNNCIAFFIQGCAGDINPVMYRDTNIPPNALPLGQMLGLSTIEAVHGIDCKNQNIFRIINETIELPRAFLQHRIDSLENVQTRLVQELRGTNINLKTFIPMLVKYNNSPEYPSYYSHKYMYEKLEGEDYFEKLDAVNRKNMETYIQNIYIMEELSRNQINLALLKKHYKRNVESGEKNIQIEIGGLRIGDFVMLTFPGELSVQIGLNIKKMSPFEYTFIAAYTNGYIYYAPTAEQLKNPGSAQEDSDCMLDRKWQEIYEARVLEMLKKL